MIRSVFWLLVSAIFVLIEGWTGFRQRDVACTVFAIVWAFIAGMYFARVVIGA